MYKRRIQSLLQAVSLETVYITAPENLRYYSGFTGGEAALVIDRGGLFLFTDSRYLIQAAQEAKDFEVVDTAKTKPEAYLKSRGIQVIGYEENFVTAGRAKTLAAALPETEWIGIDDMILDQRAVKDAWELEQTRQAAALADDAFSRTVSCIKAGARERDIAMELEWHMRKNGADSLSFEVICVSGPRSAMPHGRASDRILQKGDFVTLDFGCFIKGYTSDMTRTLVIGQASPEQRQIYQTVLSAQEKALAEIRAGITGKEADAVARDLICRAGYGEYFRHALGHGTGLSLHERPVLSPRSDTVLKPGMVVTVEPGIYVEGLGGVRIEDLVVITEQGCENLTQSDKSLTEL